MDSHEYAGKLREAAEFLESRPIFELGGNGLLLLSHYDKDKFVAAVRAVGAGKKEINEYHVTFTPKGAPLLQIYAPRDRVCRKIQDVKYECEPLLSPEEDAAMEQAAGGVL